MNSDEGLAGDSWNQRSSYRAEGGGAHPDMQLNIINARVVTPGRIRQGDTITKL